ncbi:type II toxin-antitoxin system VapC family toxin [Acidianus brierleyi]|uniref:PIN domain nuclease n=1 Tax=Acidianus brierleyi TaxID=41673 RepID=A0A2U9IGB4_9CREN|nr:type II toxin-antitoxin system VapC family toxin [Acidianus brierleyi]AWR95050.1 type II toxin-antitoxin system VapC family toxin [Acidianus brierleyi]
MENKGICLDTDALIDAFKDGIKKYSGYYTTCISVYEFLRGISYVGKDVGKFKAAIEIYLNVLCLDNNSIITASNIYSDLRKNGELIEDPDLLIGSICIANNLCLRTNNLKHFKRLERFGLRIVKE